MPPPSRRRTIEPSYEAESERPMLDAANVKPIREQIASPMAQAANGAQAIAGIDDQDELEFELPQRIQQVANGGPSASDLAMSGSGFESPFEDELETPAFLRKGGFSSLLRRGGD